MMPSAARPLGRGTAASGASPRLAVAIGSPPLTRQQPALTTPSRVGYQRARNSLKVSAVEIEGTTTENGLKVSPQVEETVRSLANDLELVRWSARLFQGEVKYGDRFRNFEGRDKYTRSHFVKETVENPKIVVKSIRIADIKSSVIVSRLTGTIAGQAVDVEFTDKFEHNQVTGRVVKHDSTWNAMAGGVAFNTSRAAWSASEAQKDLGNLVNKTLDELSFSEDDEAGMDQYRDPSDPTKFFNQKPDDGTNDMIQYALFLAVLYLIFQTYSQLQQL